MEGISAPPPPTPHMPTCKWLLTPTCWPIPCPSHVIYSKPAVTERRAKGTCRWALLADRPVPNYAIPETKWNCSSPSHSGSAKTAGESAETMTVDETLESYFWWFLRLTRLISSHTKTIRIRAWWGELRKYIYVKLLSKGAWDWFETCMVMMLCLWVMIQARYNTWLAVRTRMRAYFECVLEHQGLYWLNLPCTQFHFE